MLFRNKLEVHLGVATGHQCLVLITKYVDKYKEYTAPGLPEKTKIAAGTTLSFER